MLLKKIKYYETVVAFDGREQDWVVDGLVFKNINLIVGKNSSGKTRLTNLIATLAAMVSGKIPPNFSSGHWDLEFESTKGKRVQSQNYVLDIKNSNVNAEVFQIGHDIVLKRDPQGIGEVRRGNTNSYAKYQVPTNSLMVVVRNDAIQHPFLSEISNWGSTACIYRFGSDFGKSNTIFLGSKKIPDEIFDMASNVNNPAAVFALTREKFSTDYVNAVLQDMSAIGYECDDIFLTAGNVSIQVNSPPTVLAVKEKSLNVMTDQASMSQGMYRALAILIQVHANIFWTKSKQVGRELSFGQAPMVIIDDIGEGLDFSRATSLVQRLIELAKENKFQLIMSSNDRFIMNSVPLEYWTVLERDGGKVNVFNYENAKEKFDEFDYSGLSNFNFFSDKFFK